MIVPRSTTASNGNNDLSCSHIISGLRHQGHVGFLGNGVQCVAMATCGAIMSVCMDRQRFNSDVIDKILISGDKLYMELSPNLPSGIVFLDPEELPNKIAVGEYIATISPMASNWVCNGLFPTRESTRELSIQNLTENLINLFDFNHCDDTDNYIFTGQDYTVSFWRCNDIYVLFNSHAVDYNNHPDHDNGVARVFECKHVNTLARLLLSRNINDGRQYSLHRLRVTHVENNNSFENSPSIVENLNFTKSFSLLSVDNDLTITKSVSEDGNLSSENKTDCSDTTVSSPMLKRSKILEKKRKNKNIHNNTQEKRTINNKVNTALGPFMANCLIDNNNTNHLRTKDIPTEINNSLPDSPSIIENVKDIIYQIDRNCSDNIKNVHIKSSNSLPESPSIIQNVNIMKFYNNQKEFSDVHLIEKDIHIDSSNSLPESPSIIQNKEFIRYHNESCSILNDENTHTESSLQESPSIIQDMAFTRHQNESFSILNDENIHVESSLQESPSIIQISNISDILASCNEEISDSSTSNVVSDNTNRGGRPKFIKRGVKKSKKNSHLDAVRKYVSQNPQVNRTAVKQYSEKHYEQKNASFKQYNTSSRNIDIPLRPFMKLIGELRDNDLESVPLYAFKKCSLRNVNIYKCTFCNARLFDEERTRKQWCCGINRYNVQNFMPLVENFYNDSEFKKRSRAYNNKLSLSALGVTHGYHHPRGGISFLKIQGRIYHRVFDLSCRDNSNNVGMIINDPQEQDLQISSNYLNTTILREILNYLHNINPYIDCYKRLSRVQSDEAFITFERTNRATHGNILGDRPIGKEIAAIINTDTETYVPRSIAVWKMGDSKPHTVDIFNCIYEPFQYILLYPEGNPGWFIGKLSRDGKKLSQLKYVRCLLLSEPRFSELGRLSEEWIVDMQQRICEERLKFVLNAQKESHILRAAPLQELQDETIQGEGIIPGRIYLPSSYTGSPRYMKIKYMDAIALVNRKGKPTYFITFTCNPKWPEIQQSIAPRDYANPLICARVFNLKLTELMKDIRSGKWFGKLDYMIHVIEFQKRGLPHAHICIRIKEGAPFQNIDIDKFVRADIPDELEAGGKLRKLVLSHMIHGPCNDTNMPCWDTEKKRCSKRFPKRETDTTYSDNKGFIHYRRNSQNTATIKRNNKQVPISDLWVASYNASLLLKYDAHINVEVSTEQTIVKYLFKYMTKGPDEARVAVVPEDQLNNEIEEYVTKRYLGSAEAAWRILEFDITGREPNVKMLSVHLTNRQTIIFKVGKETESANNSASDLITYFNRPMGTEFDNLTYEDFCEQYLIHSKQPNIKNETVLATTNNRFVTKRQRGELVARLFWVPPQKGEQFYLRMLLHVFPCRGYSDLLRLGGLNCQTFQDAAKAVGLADDEVEYELAMTEASTFFTGPRLRNFLVLLAVNGAPVASLWSSFKDKICEDIIKRVGDTETAYNSALIQIGRRLRKHGSSLYDHGLPFVTDDTTELSRERIEYNSDNLKAFIEKWMPLLSGDQRFIFNYVDQLCTDANFRESNKTAIFIDGPAGTGKTLLLNVITAHVRSYLNGIVLCTASSAIAAQNHEGGTTAHSMFKFPIENDDDQGYWLITNGTQRAELIYNSNVIIYDEAPMAHKYLIHLLNRSLRDLMRNENLFGGKIIIFAGDFRQIPPVVPSAKTNSDILNASVKTSPIWNKLKTFSLSTSQRNREDSDFSDFILKLGSNQLPVHNLLINGTIHKLCELGIEFVTDLNELIDFVFGLVIDEPDVCTHRAILTTRNDSMKEINEIILARLPDEYIHFYSQDKIVNENADSLFLGVDSLNRMNPKGIPEHDLKLKIGCICMIIRNLSFADGLINGTKVIVVRTSPRLIYVRKPGKDEEYLIPRITFKALIDSRGPYEMCRRQFPLQVCYAMTIHKSQGQTISRVGVDLRSDIFSHGQLYVALGRVRERRHIKILMHPIRIINNIAFAKNVIIPGLLE